MSIKSFLAAVCMAIASFVASAAPPTIQPDTLTIGSDLTYPPFAYMQDGKPAGFDVEFMQILSKYLQLPPQFKDTRFANLITGARAGHFDVIASTLYITPERQAVLNFIPYVKVGNALLVSKDSAYRPASEKDLCGKKVGSIKGASWVPKLQALSQNWCAPNQLKPIETREFDTDAQATQALRSGAIDVECMDHLVAAELLKKFPDDYVVTSRELIYPEIAGIAAPRQNKALFQAMHAAFAQMRASGDYAALVQKYGVTPVADADVQQIVEQAR